MNNRRPLPYPNWRAPVTETDLRFIGDITSAEIQDRTKSFCDCGIVSQVNTINASSPLQVTLLPANKLSVSKGVAITLGGNLVSSYDQVTLDIPTINEEYTIFIEYDLIGVERTLTRHNTYEPSIFNKIEDAQELISASEYDINSVVCEKGSQSTPIKIDKSANFVRTELYPIERLENIVKLATATRNTTDTDTSVVLTLEGSDLRPWFSAKDIIHRSKLGSGLVTNYNPHGTALSDLTVGNLTLFDMIQDGGCIVSKDYMFPHYPGREVTVQVSYATAAAGIYFKPIENAKEKLNGTYGTTIKPYKVGYVIADGTSIQFPFIYNFETGFLFIYGTTSNYSKYNIVCYVVDCLTPYDPVEMGINAIKVAAPSKYEVAITGGIARNTLNNNQVSFDGNVVSMDFTCYLTEAGNVISNPSILGKFSISEIEVDEEQTFSASEFGVSKIGIGIRTGGSVTCDIEIRGITEDGSEDTDIITLLGGLSSVYYSTKYFTSISSWKIAENETYGIDIAEDSHIVIYAFRNWESRGKYAEICVVSHPGTNESNIQYKDTRNIGFTLNPEKQYANPFPIPAGGLIPVVESAKEMRYVDTSIMTFNGARSTLGTYKSTKLYLPFFVASTLYVYIEETTMGSVDWIKWYKYETPYTYSGWVEMALELNSTFLIGSTQLSSTETYGIIEIHGTFRNFTLAVFPT